MKFSTVSARQRVGVMARLRHIRDRLIIIFGRVREMNVVDLMFPVM